MVPSWQVSARLRLTLDRPRVIAILNLTPDSFFDGGRLDSPSSAAEAAIRARDEGADMLDIGAESTRPGAAAVPPEVQIRRLVPALAAIRGALSDMPISVDTTRASVARAALDAGADAINDVSAGLDDTDMFPLIARRDAGVILMHRLQTPTLDSYSDAYARKPEYDDVVREVETFLGGRLNAAIDAGIDRDAVVLDPGLGFGKSVEQNLALINGTAHLLGLGRPILSAVSRKSFVGRVSLGRDSTPDERLAGTLAFSIAHFNSGARLFRVHDVGSHVQALRCAGSLGAAPGASAPYGTGASRSPGRAPIIPSGS